MGRTRRAALVACAVVACGPGCGWNSEGAGKKAAGGLAIVDLDEVARQLGRDTKIKGALEQKEASLNEELSLLQSSLNTQYADQKRQLQMLSGEEQTRRLRELQSQIAARLTQARRKAQQDLAQYKAGLIAQFREDVKPVAREIAQSRGLSIVVPKNDGFVLTFEPAADITADVAERLKANPPAHRPEGGPPERISDAGAKRKH